jgi:hypothetical protein
VYLINKETLLWFHRSQSQLISTAGWSKLDFAERDQCNPVLLRLLLAIEIWKNQLCPSMVPNGWDRGRLSPRKAYQSSDEKHDIISGHQKVAFLSLT